VSGALSTSHAYDRCEAITREQAANFYYGIRLLARERRRAMCAAYAFARRVDDIGDGDLPPQRKRELLDEAGAQLAELEADGKPALPDDPVLVALADANARFRLPPGALGELIDGVRMDIDGVSYERFDDLVLYCRRVAGAIGRVCLAIFATRAGGERDDAEQWPRVERLADDLGVALQLTNILRDVREDAENGRVYLPGEDLRRFGVLAGEEGRLGGEGGEADDMPRAALLRARLDEAGASGERLVALVRFEAERAERWFAHGLELVPLLDRRSAACVSAMAGIYHRLLGRIEADPARALRGRVSLSGGEKALVAVRSVVTGRA
jgi:15-cis-phytoene synthase